MAHDQALHQASDDEEKRDSDRDADDDCHGIDVLPEGRDHVRHHLSRGAGGEESVVHDVVGAVG